LVPPRATSAGLKLALEGSRRFGIGSSYRQNLFIIEAVTFAEVRWIVSGSHAVPVASAQSFLWWSRKNWRVTNEHQKRLRLKVLLARDHVSLGNVGSSVGAEQELTAGLEYGDSYNRLGWRANTMESFRWSCSVAGMSGILISWHFLAGPYSPPLMARELLCGQGERAINLG
jgi:hypothetical protein